MRFARPPRVPVFLPVFFHTEESRRFEELTNEESDQDDLEVEESFFNTIDNILPHRFKGQKRGSSSCISSGGDEYVVNIPYKELLKFLDIE